VENRGGAGGNLGADVVAKAEPDGHTILLGTASILAANKFLYQRGMPFDPIRDFAPVTRVSTGTVLLVVNADRPWRSFADLVAAAKAAPGRISMGSSGTGTPSHLTLASINRAAGMEINHIPYRGGGPAITDLLAGTIDMMFDVMPALMPHVEAGRFLALAVSSNTRLPFLPQVPGMADFADIGLGRHGVNTWNAIMAPGGTPPEAVARLNAAIRQAGAQQELLDRLTPLGYATVTSESPAALAALIESDTPRWRELVEISGARLDG